MELSQGGFGGEFYFRAFSGQVEGLIPVWKFGLNTEITPSTDPEDIWDGGGIYAGFPTGAAETMEVLSDNVNDTLLGTGARQVTIAGLLDGDGNQMPDITVDMDGTTPVSLGAQTYGRAGRMRSYNTGATGGSVGEITLRNSTTTANIFSKILAGKTGTSQMTYTVPMGFNLKVFSGNIKIARDAGLAGSAEASLLVRAFGQESFAQELNPVITTSDSYEFGKGAIFVFPERTDFKIQIVSVSGNNTFASSEFYGLLEANS